MLIEIDLSDEKDLDILMSYDSDPTVQLGDVCLTVSEEQLDTLFKKILHCQMSLKGETEEQIWNKIIEPHLEEFR